MKIKTLSDIKDMEKLTRFTYELIYLYKKKTGKDINKEKHQKLEKIMKNINLFNILTERWVLKFTDEYKELNNINNKIIYRTEDIMRSIKNVNPIEIFATYIYMYRKGYLSHNKKFIYNNNLFDIYDLYSIDIYRGNGVCRSISALLTSIYKEFGYKDANSISVRIINNEIENCSDIELDDDENYEEPLIINLASKLADYLNLRNHKITLVSDNNYSYKLDPTNDTIIFNNQNTIIKKDFFMDSLLILLGFETGEINMFKQENIYNMKEISLEEYKKYYKKALKRCKKHQDMFEDFYNQNKNLYNEVYNITNQCEKYLKLKF